MLTIIRSLSATAATPPPPLLNNFRVVCVGPSQPGNVGAIARAAANFECPELFLVAPEYDRNSDESGSYERRFAMQLHAQALLSNAPVHDTLQEAISDCVAAVGFTRRRGEHRTEASLHMPVGGLAALGHEARPGKVALIFGREASGLLSSELLLCTHACEIATSSVQGSMSLPAAAAFALGRTFEEALALEDGDESRPLGGGATSPRAAHLSGPAHGGRASTGGYSKQLATLEELESVMGRWERLADVEEDPALRRWGKPSKSGDQWVRTARGTRATTSHGRATAMLRRMLQRAAPTSREIKALHGALAGLESGLSRGKE